MKRRSVRRWLLIVLLICCLGVLGVVSFLFRTAILSFAGSTIIDSEAPQPADLILVLGGDFYGPRVVLAAELGVRGYSRTVLFSSPPYKNLPEGNFAIAFLTGKGYPRDLFQVFAHHAESTVDEAIALERELARRHVKRVILVTSAYHSRRAALVMRLFAVTAPDVEDTK